MPNSFNSIPSPSASDSVAYLDIQYAVVSGKVTDENGDPLPGVNIVVKSNNKSFRIKVHTVLDDIC